MIPGGRSFPGSRVSFFAEILKKNLPVTPGLTESCESQSTLPVSNGPRKEVLDQQAKRTYARGYAVKPDVSPKALIDRYMDGDLHAISLLHQLAQILQFHLEIKETVTTGNVTGLYFAFCVVIDGVGCKTGMGITKKEARLKAAEFALQELLPSLKSPKSFLPEASGVPPPLPVKEECTIFDIHPSRAICEKKNSVNLQIPHAVRDQLTKLMNSHPEFSACAGTTAAFIIQTSSGCEVVALGTGSYNTKENASSGGRLVHDSHAVVTARRSLMRFLYWHLLMFFSKTANLTQKSIFNRSSSSGLLSLKSGITLHLYLNQLPKGAAQITSKLRLRPLSIFAWQANNDISLHLSVEGKVFSVFSLVCDHSASKVVSMSATDKITQWQVLGCQGALLSHFIEPIYVQSILIGDSGSDIRGMEISVSQRAEGITAQLPQFYCVMRPHISLVPSVATDSTDSGQLTYSVNWSEGDSSVEVVDGLEGKTIEESPFKSGPAMASRLCKAAMLHRFKLVAKEAQREDLLATSSYRQAKKMAKPYQEAKNILKAYLLQQGFGPWLVKPSVCDNFSM